MIGEITIQSCVAVQDAVADTTRGRQGVERGNGGDGVGFGSC